MTIKRRSRKLNRLPVTRASKSEAAWRLMVARHKGRRLTWEGIADLTTVHRSTIVRMDLVLKKLGDKVAELPWLEALQMARNKMASSVIASINSSVRAK